MDHSFASSNEQKIKYFNRTSWTVFLAHNVILCLYSNDPTIQAYLELPLL